MADQAETPGSVKSQPTAHIAERVAGRVRRSRIYEKLKRVVSQVLQDDGGGAPAQFERPAPPTEQPPQAVKMCDTTPPIPASEAASPAPSAANEDKAPPSGPGDEAKAQPPAPTDQATPAVTQDSATAAQIADAAKGLTFISETDAPVEPFVWSAQTPFSPEALRTDAKSDATEPLKTEDIDHFFRNVTVARDWHEDAEKEQVRRFTALRDLLKAQLRDITVYRFGSTAIEVYVVGHDAAGAVMGVHTKVVET